MRLLIRIAMRHLRRGRKTTACSSQNTLTSEGIMPAWKNDGRTPPSGNAGRKQASDPCFKRDEPRDHLANVGAALKRLKRIEHVPCLRFPEHTGERVIGDDAQL